MTTRQTQTRVCALLICLLITVASSVFTTTANAADLDARSDALPRAGEVELSIETGHSRVFAAGLGYFITDNIALRASGGMGVGWGVYFGNTPPPVPDDMSPGPRWDLVALMSVVGLESELVLPLTPTQALTIALRGDLVEQFAVGCSGMICEPDDGYALSLGVGWGWFTDATDWRVEGGATFIDMHIDEPHEDEVGEYRLLPTLSIAAHWRI